MIESIGLTDGFITFRDIKQGNLSYKAVNQLVSEGILETDERGIYRLPDTYIDEYYSLQYRFPKGIFSLDMALWLHGLSLTVPFEPTMTFPFGTNTRGVRDAGIKAIVVRSNYEVGVTENVRQPGQLIRVYDKERSLVECLRPIYKMDVQIIAPAFKRYMASDSVNLKKLVDYAKLFKVEQRLQSYIEVLT